MTHNVGFTFSVGDTTPRFTISIEQDQLELVTLNIIFSHMFPRSTNHKSTSFDFPFKNKGIFHKILLNGWVILLECLNLNRFRYFSNSTS